MSHKTPAYLIAGYKVNNPEGLARYLENVGPIVQKYSGKVIAFNQNIAALEGSTQPAFVIVEFPSLQEAESFYHSEEYQPVKAFRVGATEGYVFITESIPPESLS